MNTNVSINGAARSISLPKDHTRSTLPDRIFRPSAAWKASLNVHPGHYQVALVSTGSGSGDGNPARDDRGPRVLLLPLTWDDLISRVHHSNAEHSQKDTSSTVTQFGDIRIDFLRHETKRAGEPVNLTAFEFKVLKFFISNPYRVVSRAELLDTVWGYNCYPTTRTVDNQILRLRQKLEPEPANPVHFQTVYGAGYKFIP